MLDLLGARRHGNCAGWSRRDFLRAGALGACGLLLPDLLRARAAAPARAKDTSVIWIWLGGGPSHIETFDPKMTAPAEIRSMVGAVKTNVPGVEIGGLFPRIAAVADKMAFVRSLGHVNFGHAGATHWIMTGHDHPPADLGQAPIRPSLGSVLSRSRGASHPVNGLPTYVRIQHTYADGPAWLGEGHGPFEFGGAAHANLHLKIDQRRLEDRRTLLKKIDALDRAVDSGHLLDSLDEFEQRAFQLVVGNARETFDLQREDPNLRAHYGKGIGEHLLLARRLCEAGVGFVSVHYGGWDHHEALVPGMKNLSGPLDRAVAALVRDLADRGLDEKVLVVLTGEFGRTPTINPTGGRDHWARLVPLALAGGGLKMGQVVGESATKADVPKSRAYSPQDLMATIFHVLGLPLDLQFQDPGGRPTPMIDNGTPIKELV